MENSINGKNKTKYVNLDDYKIFDYEIPEIFLDFVINTENVSVNTELRLNKINKKVDNLILDGEDIFIKNIYINGSPLDKNFYTQNRKNLIIENIYYDSFILKIEGIIKPKENLSLLGLYESNGIITTQCEAEGFRRISSMLIGLTF